MKKTSKNYLILFTSITIIGWYYGLYKIVFFEPQSQHLWRQCDGLMMMYNFYIDDHIVSTPKLNNYFSEERARVSDFPIFYYLGGLICKFTGYKEYILRFIFGLVYFIGIFYLYKICEQFFSSKFIPLIVPLFVFSSPLLVYYGVNYMPDVAALSISIIGMYYVLIFLRGKTSALFIAVCFFSLAGIIRPTALTLYLASLCTYFLMILKKKILIPSLWKIVLVLTPVIICISWFSFTRNYNSIGGSPYFLAEPLPIWKTNLSNILEIIHRFCREWWQVCIWKPLLVFICILCPIVLVKAFKKDFFFFSFITFTLLVSLSILLLFFQFYYHHDYGLILLSVAPITTGFSAIYLYKDLITKSFFIKIIISVILIFSIHNVKSVLDYRYYHYDWDNDFDTYKGLNKHIDSLGISTKIKVASMSDYSSGISLYRMKRNGYTQLSASSVSDAIKKGATLIILKKEDTSASKNMENILLDTLPSYKELVIYKVR